MHTELLATVPLFLTLTEQELTELSTLVTERAFADGDQIFLRGDPGNSLLIIASGSVEISMLDPTGAPIILETLAPGAVFGELVVFDGGPRTATATARGQSAVLELRAENLQRFLRGSPAAALHLLQTLAVRCRKSADLLQGRVARNASPELEARLSVSQRFATWIAECSGSMMFLVLNLGFFAVWIALNLGALPAVQPFDPYPFGLLTMAVSLEAIFLSISVLLAQNLQSARERTRSDIEYEVNLRAELEIAALHQKLDTVNASILERLNRIEGSR